MSLLRADQKLCRTVGKTIAEQQSRLPDYKDRI